MGSWDDWAAIEAAMAKQQADDVERRAVRQRRKALRVLGPTDTPADPSEPPEAVLDAPEESWPPAKPPIERSPIDPVAGLRLYVRHIRDQLGRGDR